MYPTTPPDHPPRPDVVGRRASRRTHIAVPRALLDAGLTDAEVVAELRRLIVEDDAALVAQYDEDVARPAPEVPTITHRAVTAPPDLSGTWPGGVDRSERGPLTYALYRAGDLRYIGATEYLWRRLDAHARGGRTFDTWSAWRLPDRLSADVFEAAMIEQWRPPENASAAAQRGIERRRAHERLQQVSR